MGSKPCVPGATTRVAEVKQMRVSPSAPGAGSAAHGACVPTTGMESGGREGAGRLTYISMGVCNLLANFKMHEPVSRRFNCDQLDRIRRHGCLCLRFMCVLAVFCVGVVEISAICGCH